MLANAIGSANGTSQLVPPLLSQAGAETKTNANKDQTTNTATQADKHAQAQHATSCAVNAIGFA